VVQDDRCGIEEIFFRSLPAKPYCADQLNYGLKIKERHEAIRHKHVQFNHPAKYRWITFDIDRPGAYFAAEEANLPEPTVISINPLNGHAHLSYLLEVPVHNHANSPDAPLWYLAAIQRGFTRRLRADRRYSGLIAKNPLHQHWRTDWQALRPYPLDELADSLDKDDMAPFPQAEMEIGVGRNCSIFDSLRKFAYRLYTAAAKDGVLAFRKTLALEADQLNEQFTAPLSPAEIRGIVKSVAKWVWRKFSLEKFSEIQRRRGKRGAAKSWAGHTKCEPWNDLGISRRTYYRRKAAGTLNE